MIYFIEFSEHFERKFNSSKSILFLTIILIELIITFLFVIPFTQSTHPQSNSRKMYFFKETNLNQTFHYNAYPLLGVNENDKTIWGDAVKNDADCIMGSESTATTVVSAIKYYGNYADCDGTDLDVGSTNIGSLNLGTLWEAPKSKALLSLDQWLIEIKHGNGGLQEKVLYRFSYQKDELDGTRLWKVFEVNTGRSWDGNLILDYDSPFDHQNCGVYGYTTRGITGKWYIHVIKYAIFIHTESYSIVQNCANPTSTQTPIPPTATATQTPILLTTTVLSSRITCNIAQRSVEFKRFDEGHRLICNDGNKVNLVNDDSFTITGSSSSNNVYIKMWQVQILTIIFDSLTITNNYPIQVSSELGYPGTLTIILKGTNKLTSTGDIYNDDNYGPTLWCRESIIIIKEFSSGSNSLTVTAFKGNPAIGTLSFCKKIKIESGYITAKGSGNPDQPYYENGAVKREDLIDNRCNQEVRYTSGAGIGTGIYGFVELIEITGGTVDASGGYYAPGIGCGPNGVVTTITISGGSITAHTSKNGAGIGTGYGHKTDYGYVDTLTISDGIINANYDSDWTHGAGIGAGNGYVPNSGFINTLNILGGIIVSKVGHDSAGIGNGFSEFNRNDDDSTGLVRSFTIRNDNNLHFCAASGHVNNALGLNPKNVNSEDKSKVLKNHNFLTGITSEKLGSYYVSYYPSTFKDHCPSYIPPTEVPTQPLIEPPTEPPTSPPTNPPTEPPTNPPTEPPTNPPTSPPTNPPTSPPTNPPTSPPTNPPTSPPTNPPTNTPTEVQSNPSANELVNEQKELPPENNSELKTESSNQQSITWIIIGIVGGVLVIAGVTIGLIVYHKKHKAQKIEG